MRRWTAGNGGVELGGRLGAALSSGPGGRGGRDGEKKGEETIWFSCRRVKCGAGGREREGGGRGREPPRMGEPRERRWMGEGSGGGKVCVAGGS